VSLARISGTLRHAQIAKLLSHALHHLASALSPDGLARYVLKHLERVFDLGIGDGRIVWHLCKVTTRACGVYASALRTRQA
jgi:hypothetical protein